VLTGAQAFPEASEPTDPDHGYYFTTLEVDMQSRVVFMGTPEFAVPALEVLAERVGAGNLLVVTQPDRAAGRGRKLQAPPVKAAAERLGLPVEQVATLRDPAVRELLEGFAPELIVVAAFGLLLPRWVLRLPSRGCVNLHASILPRFRGASPIPAAIACGDAATGVALMEMEAGLDTGGVYALKYIDITEQHTTESLTGQVAEVAARVLAEHLDDLLAGEISPVPQRGQIVETRKIVKAHGAIDWSRPAEEIERHVRAMWPWPRAWAVGAGGERIQVHRATVAPAVDAEPGVIVASDGEGIVVATGDGGLQLTRVQLSGKTARPAGELRQHPTFAIGGRFENPAETVEPWIVVDGETGS
jgi:methionyl-tRNA formyltransferase